MSPFLGSLHPARASPSAPAVNITTADRTDRPDIERDARCLDSMLDALWAGGPLLTTRKPELRCARWQLVGVSPKLIATVRSHHGPQLNTKRGGQRPRADLNRRPLALRALFSRAA